MRDLMPSSKLRELSGNRWGGAAEAKPVSRRRRAKRRAGRRDQQRVGRHGIAVFSIPSFMIAERGVMVVTAGQKKPIGSVFELVLNVVGFRMRFDRVPRPIG